MKIETSEIFLEPIYFTCNCIKLRFAIERWLQKALFVSLQFYNLEEPRQVEAQGPPLSAKVQFATFDPAVSKISGNNHRVSHSVFKVKRIIE